MTRTNCSLKFIIQPDYRFKCLVQPQTMIPGMSGDGSEAIDVMQRTNSYQQEIPIVLHPHHSMHPSQHQQYFQYHGYYGFKGCLRFDRNELLYCEEQPLNETIQFLYELIAYPTSFQLYPISFQNKQYFLLGESLFALVLYQFIKQIEKEYRIIGHVEFMLQFQSYPLILQRLYKALDMINILRPTYDEELLQEQEELYKSQKELVLEILENKASFERYWKQIERAKYFINPMDPRAMPLRELNYNFVYNPNEPYRFGFNFTLQEREQFRLFGLDKKCLEITSRYLETIDDLISLELSVKRMKGLIAKSEMNTVRITKETKDFYPNLKVLQLMDIKDELFLDDEKIEKRIMIKDVHSDQYIIASKEIKERVDFKNVYILAKELKDTIEPIVTKIKFSGESLKSNNIIIPSTITSIEERCFSRIEAKEITIEGNIKRLEKLTFFGCESLKKIELPKTLQYIGDECFRNCNELEEIEIPESVTWIGKRAFSGCTKLKRITIGSQWNCFGDRLFCISKGVLTSVQIPKSVIKINDIEITVTPLTQYSIPEGVQSLSEYCFIDSEDLTEIYLPYTIRFIHDTTFFNCPKIKTEDARIYTHMKRVPFITIHQKRLLERWSTLEVQDVLFDSESDNWKFNHQALFEALQNKKEIMMVIKDSDDIMYGVFIGSKIEKTAFQAQGFHGIDFNETNIFTFVLNPSIKTLEPKKFTLTDDGIRIQLKRHGSSTLIEIPNLFEIQNNVDHLNVKFSYYTGFDYQNYGNIRGDQTGVTYKTIKQVQVYQLGDNEENKMQKEAVKASLITSESNLMIDSSAKHKKEYHKEIEKIEEFCEMGYDTLLFDTEDCSWESGRSTFGNILYNKKNICILIEDTEGNRFGGFIEEKIDEYYHCDDLVAKGAISDSNALLFEIRTLKSKKYPIIERFSSTAFYLYDEDSMGLFSFGLDDIFVTKKGHGHSSFRRQNIFDYEGDEEKHETSKSSFSVKRIRVYQMKLTDKWKKVRDEKQKQRELKEKKRITERNKSLKEETSKYRSNHAKYIKRFEEWTTMEFGELLFDTKSCLWAKRKSDFFKQVYGKEKLLILINSSAGNIFGGYINPKITGTMGEKGITVGDYDSFLYSLKIKFRGKGKYKYRINPEQRQKVFTIYGDDSDKLFTFGDNDIVISKESSSNYGTHNKSSFEYEGMDLPFGDQYNKTSFEIDRIRVFQMIETPGMKEMKKKTEEGLFNDQINSMRNQIETTKETFKETLQALHQWTCSTVKDVVYDSVLCNHEILKSTFDKHILGKDKLAFVITDVNDNVFGCYINKQIDSFTEEQFLEKGKLTIHDQNAIVFTIMNNRRLLQPVQFFIKQTKDTPAFQIFNKYYDNLFVIGNNDIVIPKKGIKKVPSINFSTYRLGGNEWTFTGKETGSFNFKRIVVFQMERTGEQEQLYNEITTHREEIRLKKVEEENIQLKTKTEEMKQQEYIQVNQIEEMCTLTFEELLFDSTCCDMGQHTSTFKSHIFNKDNLVFLIEDTKGNIFGHYMKKTLNKVYEKIKGEWKGSGIVDKDSFSFSLHSGDRHRLPKIIPWKSDNKDSTVTLYSDDWWGLITFGYEDIYIPKKEMIHRCYCSTENHDFGKYPNIFTGATGKDENKRFELKRLRVLQMTDSEDWKKRKGERDMQMDYMRHQQVVQECSKLQQLTRDSIIVGSEDLNKIEKWTDASFGAIVFDSDYCDWDISTSTFFKHVYGRDHVVFVIIDKNNNIFGCYVENKIDQYACKQNLYKKEVLEEENYIDDKHCFVFSIYSNGRYQQHSYFPIKSHERKAFALHTEEGDVLFRVGSGNDIYIKKKSERSKCYCKAESFDYKGRTGILTGTEGKKQYFETYRIQVWQMYEPPEKVQKKIELEHQKMQEVSQRLQSIIPISVQHPESIQLGVHEWKQLEEWTSNQFDHCIFDSDKDDWKKKTSKFDEMIQKKKRVMIIIEDLLGNVFGFYTAEELKSVMKQYEDKHSFCFTLRSNGRIPTMKKFDYKKGTSFVYYPSGSDVLFSVGENISCDYDDITIMKQDCMNVGNGNGCKQNCFFYGRWKDALCGSDHFEVKRFIVFEMKENKED